MVFVLELYQFGFSSGIWLIKALSKILRLLKLQKQDASVIGAGEKLAL